MQKIGVNSQSYLLSFSNFIAAFGGGMILGKGVDVINIALLKGGSILAFFIGTILGLFFLQLIPRKISAFLARLFSIFSGTTSFLLLGIFLCFAQNGRLENIAGVLFFFVLALRFGFWFYSRALRASLVAGQQQNIARVELGYYAGMILGLIVWSFPGTHLLISSALLVDGFLQFFAAFIDFYAYKISKQITLKESIKIRDKDINQESPPSWRWRLITALTFLTIGTQSIIFGLIQQISKFNASVVMAAFYVGVLIAAIICKKYKVSLGLHTGTQIVFHRNISKYEIHFSLICFLTAAMAFFTTYTIYYGSLLLVLLLTGLSAYFYEILALAIIDRVGLEENYFHNKGLVMRSYGYMGTGSAVGFWFLTLIDNSMLQHTVFLISCFLISWGVFKMRPIK